MKNKIIIAVLIVCSVVAYVSISGGNKEAYKSNQSLTVKI